MSKRHKMVQFLGEFTQAEPATGSKPARVKVHYLNKAVEWLTVEDLIQVSQCVCGLGGRAR